MCRRVNEVLDAVHEHRAGNPGHVQQALQTQYAIAMAVQQHRHPYSGHGHWTESASGENSAQAAHASVRGGLSLHSGRCKDLTAGSDSRPGRTPPPEVVGDLVEGAEPHPRVGGDVLVDPFQHQQHLGPPGDVGMDGGCTCRAPRSPARGSWRWGSRASSRASRSRGRRRQPGGTGRGRSPPNGRG